MSLLSGTVRSTGKQFFNLESVREGIEELKKGLFKKKDELNDVRVEVEYGKRKIDELNECSNTLKMDIVELDKDISTLKSYRDNDLKDALDKAQLRAEELARIYEEKRQLLEDMTANNNELVKSSILEQRKELYKTNQNNLKIEKDIKEIERKLNPSRKVLVGDKESYIERILQNKIQKAN